MEVKRLHAVAAVCALAPLLPLPAVAANNVVANPICTDNTANFNPTLPIHCSSPGVHGVGIRLGPELSDGNRVPRQFAELSSVRSGIRPRSGG